MVLLAVRKVADVTETRIVIPSLELSFYYFEPFWIWIHIAVYINCNTGVKQEQESIFEIQERSRSGKNQTPHTSCLNQRWAWSGSGSEPDFDLFWPDRIGAGLGFSAGSDRNRIAMSRVCQLKYAMSYVRTPLSFKSKRRIELLIYNSFQRMIPQSPQFHKSLRLLYVMIQ